MMINIQFGSSGGVEKGINTKISYQLLKLTNFIHVTNFDVPKAFNLCNF